MKYYNFETRFVSLKDALCKFLKENNIYYELSGAYSYYHFEIKLDEHGVATVNSWLDEHTITEQS